MTIYLDLGLLLAALTAFFFSVLGYFLISRFFQAKRRRGILAGDGAAFLAAGGLFIAFTASFIEIFEFAFRLPYPAMIDLGIGLTAVFLASATAHLLAKRLSKAPNTNCVTVSR
ncbi:hypothetical protein [Roseibium sp. MMSF_3412]|uniref:hypothetical protein n=1 Tax=Roseibium sp. MMSF_3412 TaxID=3046712 RepID=UPI00274015AA|nr:hypothetical protein [Roseibium sp. MMSF_3412]